MSEDAYDGSLPPKYIFGCLCSLLGNCDSVPSSIGGLFLSDPGVPGVRSMGPVLSQSLQDLVQTKLM